MSEYEWDNRIEYLSQTRWLYYNDDYLEFLVQKVWKINRPVKIIDYGCGYGYLGLKLLPLLPKGSAYTGVDKGSALIAKAKEIFADLHYPTEFVVGDVEDIDIDRKYDIAMCHAFLLHMTNPTAVLKTMIQSVVDNGKIICFEPHWIGNMANYGFAGLDQTSVIPLGVLQKLFEKDANRNGKDGNIGISLPIMLSRLGIKNIDCRVSDRVNFLDQNMDLSSRERLYRALTEEGIGQAPGDRDETVEHLIARGLTAEEAATQYEAERYLSQAFDEHSWLTYAPNMKITFGTVQR
ncbi:class I SAM-dependent methyltransferase [Cohnella yongneupensis]|uniref:Class I SAM-dependent methyltransferase n=1 Tax=Cohnella yongneupensis TaxID=425006 RepID=A0ABW0QXE8_9BACL